MQLCDEMFLNPCAKNYLSTQFQVVKLKRYLLFGKESLRFFRAVKELHKRKVAVKPGWEPSYKRHFLQ